MNTVTIEQKRGEPEKYRYAPMDPKEHDGKLRFYAEGKNGWRVITLEAIRPHGGGFIDDAGKAMEHPFHDSPPKEILPCRLLAPPCYESEDEANQNRPANWPDCLIRIPEAKWGLKAVYWKTHGEALWVKPEHEGEPRGPKGTRKGGPLRKLLAQLHWAARADRRRDVAAWEQEIRKRAELQLEKLKYTSEEHRQQRLGEARQQLEACKRYWRSIETLTLDDFKRGCWSGEGDSPRDGFLVSDWAERTGVDLIQMDRDAEACREWIKKHCQNATAFVQDHRHGMRLNRIESKLLFDVNEKDALDTMLALVRYKIMFEDGSLLFLAACEMRQLRSSELAEVGALEPMQKDNQEYERAFRRVLEEMKPEEIDKEIIRLRFNDNLSQDKIVAMLRKQKRGKSKRYVGSVIGEFNKRLEMHGLRRKHRVTGQGIQKGERYKVNQTAINTAEVDNRTPDKKLELDKIRGYLRQWPELSESDRKTVLDEYPEIKRYLARGKKDGLEILNGEIESLEEKN